MRKEKKLINALASLNTSVLDMKMLRKQDVKMCKSGFAGITFTIFAHVITYIYGKATIRGFLSYRI